MDESKITNVVLDGIDTNDYPDFADAYIVSADYDGREMTEEAMLVETFFRVANKDGEDVDFKLNSAQRAVDEQLTGRDLIPKARQEGVSMGQLARGTAKCLMERNVSAALISPALRDKR